MPNTSTTRAQEVRDMMCVVLIAVTTFLSIMWTVFTVVVALHHYSADGALLMNGFLKAQLVIGSGIWIVFALFRGMLYFFAMDTTNKVHSLKNLFFFITGLIGAIVTQASIHWGVLIEWSLWINAFGAAVFACYMVFGVMPITLVDEFPERANN